MKTLSPDDLVAVTGKKLPAAQIAVLQAMQVPHLVRPDGKPVVHELALLQAMGVKLDSDRA